MNSLKKLSKDFRIVKVTSFNFIDMALEVVSIECNTASRAYKDSRALNFAHFN